MNEGVKRLRIITSFKRNIYCYISISNAIARNTNVNIDKFNKIGQYKRFLLYVINRGRYIRNVLIISVFAQNRR